MFSVKTLSHRQARLIGSLVSRIGILVTLLLVIGGVAKLFGQEDFRLDEAKGNSNSLARDD